MAPKSVPVENIILNIKAGIRDLSQEVAEEIRQESARILRQTKPPKCNLPEWEKKALRDLGADDNIIFLPADKGSATVLMNALDYQQNIQELLDPETYKKLSKDPTGIVVRKTNKLMK